MNEKKVLGSAETPNLAQFSLEDRRVCEGWRGWNANTSPADSLPVAFAHLQDNLWLTPNEAVRCTRQGSNMHERKPNKTDV